MSARNYICNDGSKSIGIPEDIYTPGKPITAHPEFTEPERPEIQLEVQDVTAEGARLLWHIPSNYSGSSFFTGSPFGLEARSGSAWEPLKMKVNPSWDVRELEHVPFSGGEFRVEYSVSWAGFYGLLPAGTYRITTSVFGSMGPETTAEFTVAPSPD